MAHEFTHAVTENTAGLNYEKQSGALNESFSDMFACTIDGNWTIAEGTALGTIRSISDPPSILQGTLNGKKIYQPDKLFSTNYMCFSDSATCSSTTNDSCGVHSNGGVTSKAFYLMADGGSFNDCNVTGIGVVKSLAIMYQVLTRHLTQTSTFDDFYKKPRSLRRSGTVLFRDLQSVQKRLATNGSTPSDKTQVWLYD
jgi:Zn-dependent metalloprotease